MKRLKKAACVGMSIVMTGCIFFAQMMTEAVETDSGTALVTQSSMELPFMQAPKADSGMTAANGTAVVSGGTVNVRSGPSTSYSVLGTVKLGAKVTICGKFSNGWYKIEFHDGYGYMTGQYLSSFNWAAEVKPFSATAVTTDRLNVRSGNGTSYAKLGLLPENTAVKITGKYANGWYEIEYNGGKGCVSGDYLKDIRENSATTTAATTATTAPTTVTTAVITTASTTAAPTTVTTAAAETTAATTTAPATTAPTTTSPVTTTEAATTTEQPSVTEIPTTVVTTTVPTTQKPPVQELTPMNATAVTTDNLNVRKGNGTNYEKLGTLPKGTTVQIIGVYKNKWYQIKYGSGIGAVCGDYLKNIKPVETTTTAPTTAQPQDEFAAMNARATTTANLNMRKGNSTKYEIIALIPNGTVINVIGRYSNNWYRVNYQGQVGCVSGDYLKNITEITQPAETTSTSALTTTETTVTATAEPTTIPEETTTQPAVRPEDNGIVSFYGRGVTTDNLNVRKGPSTAYDKLGTIPAGTTVALVGKFPKTNWYKIIYGSDYAYVCGDYLKNIVELDESGLYMDSRELTLRLEESRKLKVYSLFNHGGEADVDWQSDAPEIVSVDANGNVTANACGSAVITATDKSGRGSISCTINVLSYSASAHISGVPIYNQLTSGYPTGCEQFSARMLVNYYGGTATAEDMVKAITLSPAPYLKGKVKYGGDPSSSFVGDPKQKKPYGFGCLPSAITAGINRYMAQIGGGYKAVDISGCDMETIYSYISKGVPVLAASAYLPSVNNPYKDSSYSWVIDRGRTRANPLHGGAHATLW